MTEALITAVTDLMGVCTTVITYVTGNPILCLCFVAGTVVPAGIHVYRKLKRA